MSSPGVAPCAAVPVSSARAEASRRNGARSRGPKTPEGKARSARNALKHGLRAQKYVVLPEEDAAEFAALETALIDELAPQGVLQSILVGRIARAAWRLERAERLEAEVLAARRYGDADLGLALIRDGNGTRSFDTLLRYRGAAMAEFMRSLRMLKALQAEQAARRVRAAALAEAPAPGAPPRPAAVAPILAAEAVDRPASRDRRPIEPESCGNLRKSAPPDDDRTRAAAIRAPHPSGRCRCRRQRRVGPQFSAPRDGNPPRPAAPTSRRHPPSPPCGKRTLAPTRASPALTACRGTPTSAR